MIMKKAANGLAIFGIAITLVLSLMAYDLIRSDHPIGGIVEAILAIICASMTYFGYKDMRQRYIEEKGKK